MLVTRARSLPAVLLVSLGLAGGLAACGGDDSDSSSSSTAAVETTAPPAAGDGGATAPSEDRGGADGGGAAASDAEGRTVFADNCAGCHTLAAAQASGVTGPNLDEVRPSAEVVAEKVRNGGGGMPAFGGRLDDAQIEAVAAFVSSNAGS